MIFDFIMLYYIMHLFLLYFSYAALIIVSVVLNDHWILFCCELQWNYLIVQGTMFFLLCI